MMTPPNILIQLIHIHGGLKGEILEFGDSVITVGRLSACTVRFPADEPGVSREHATIRREGNQFKLIDASTYGTFVNGKQVKEAFLKNGDVMEFGPGGPKVSINMEIGATLPASSAPAPAHPAPTPVREVAPPVVENQPYVEPAMVTGGNIAASGNAYTAANQHPAVSNVFREPEPMAPVAVPVQKKNVPLIIQYGPTIRTYQQLPVVIGSNGRADFVLQHPGIYDQHAQIFFYQDDYWITDLTGQGLITINRRRINVQAQLNELDEIQCTPQGPVFRFLGDGRLAEVEPVIEEPAPRRYVADEIMEDTSVKREEPNILSRFMKGFKR